MRPERLQAAYSVLRPVAKFSAVYDVHTADFQRVDFAAIKHNTETLDAAARRQIANLVAASVWKLIGDADRMRELLDQDVSDIAQVKIDAFDIGKLKAACKQALVNAWELGAAQSRREIIKSSGHKYGRSTFAKKPTTLRDNAAAYLDANGMRMAQNLGDGARSMIQQELTRAVRTGIAPTEAAAIILDRLVSKGFTDREGIEGAGVTQDVLDEMEALDDVADAPAYINTLVRTNTFEAMNEARFAEFTDPELDGWVVAFEYSSILDENTTEFCRYMDGRVYAADNEVWDTHRPPNHYNCRSLLIPITKSSGWDGQESDPPEVDPATGFARCGCGKVHFTYDESQHPRDENGKWTDGGSSAAQEIQSAALQGTDGRIVLDVHPVTSSEAREFGSTLKGDHAYIGAFSKTASAAPGEAKAALQRAVDKADALGTHLLVGAEDDGSGKLIALYESFGFKQINSDLPGTVMLRPASASGARFSYDESQHPRDENGRWTDGGGGGEFDKDVGIAAAYAAPKGEFLPTGRKVPLPVNEDIRDRAERVVEAGAPLRMTLKVSDLIATQPEVRLTRVKALLENWDRTEDRIQVSEIDGKYYVVDGHHRAAAQIWAGAQSIEADVFKQPEKFTEHGLPRSVAVQHSESPNTGIAHDEGARSTFEWDESLHPRAPDGRFGDGAGAGLRDPERLTEGMRDQMDILSRKIAAVFGSKGIEDELRALRPGYDRGSRKASVIDALKKIAWHVKEKAREIQQREGGVRHPVSRLNSEIQSLLNDLADKGLSPARVMNSLRRTILEFAAYERFEYDEALHPRDERGRWTSGGSTAEDLSESVPQALQSLGKAEGNGKHQPNILSSGGRDALIAQATEAQPQFVKAMTEVASIAEGELVQGNAEVMALAGRLVDNPEIDSPMVLVADMKDMHGERFDQKVRDEYGGDYSQLRDVVRGTILAPKASDIPAVIDSMREQGMKIAGSPTDRINNVGPNGYRDINFKVEMPNGHIAEVQVMTPAIFAAKMTICHRLYEEIRPLTGRLQKEGREPTRAEARIIADNNRRQRQIYDQAWKRDQ